MNLYQNLSFTTDLSQDGSLYNSATYDTNSLNINNLNISSGPSADKFYVEKDKDTIEFDITSSSNSSAPSIKYKPLIFSTYANVGVTNIKVNVSSTFDGNNFNHSNSRLQTLNPELLFIKDGHTLISTPANPDSNTIFMKLEYFCMNPPIGIGSNLPIANVCKGTNANGQALTGAQSSDPSFTYNIGSSDAEKNARSTIIMLAPSEIRFGSSVTNAAYKFKYNLSLFVN